MFRRAAIGVFLALGVLSPVRADVRLVVDAYTHHTTPCYHSPEGCLAWHQPRRLSLQAPLAESLRIDLGIGRNSHGYASVSSGILFEPLHTSVVEWGLWAGFATGYRCDTCRLLTPAAGVSGTLKLQGGMILQVLAIPPAMQGLAVVQLRLGQSF